MIPLLYVVRMDVQPDYIDEFVRWYDTRHAPDLIGTGFHSCSAYHSRVGGPFICNVYEVPGLEIFSSEAYVQVRKDDRQLMSEVIPRISNHSNTIYRQEVIVGADSADRPPGDRPSRSVAVCAPVVATFRLDCADAEHAKLADWFRNVETRRQSVRPGFLRARLARQCGKHPLFPSSQPEWLVLTEWASIRDALADGTPAELTERYRRQLEPAISGLEYNLAALSATLLNADSWTN